jgi:uncharacterized caspase-like protein
MRKALVVGIDDYPSSKLSGCVKDAIGIANVLEKNSDGSPNFKVKLLTDKSDGGINRTVLRRDIEKLFEGICDVALFYFSGHGIIKSSGGYIVTSDFERYDEGISMDEVLKLANNSKARDRVIILDCCHSGYFGNPSINDSIIAQLSDGLTVLTACRDKEVAIEKAGSGVFTSLLIDALQGGAADLRGHVTPGSLYAYVDEALGAWDQRPIFKTNISKFISLRRINPRIPLETLRKITIYFKSPEDEFSLDPSYEFTEASAISEHVAIMKDLQKLQSVGLVVPVNAEYMYFAAINSKSCRLTAIGYQYWRLVTEKNL